MPLGLSASAPVLVGHLIDDLAESPHQRQNASYLGVRKPFVEIVDDALQLSLRGRGCIGSVCPDKNAKSAREYQEHYH